jgi:carboxyl-terminal processing protease
MNESIKVSPTRRRLLQLVGTAPALALASPTLRAQPQPHEAGEATRSAAVSADDTTFENVWRTVRDRFYDPHLHGLDWAAVGERYRSVAAQATSKEQQAAVINSMLLELHASHTHYYMQDEPEFYQLAGIFTGALRRQGLQRIFPDGHISYPGIGILSRMDTEARGVVLGVIDGTPARQAGLLPGDEIVTIDGAPFQPVQSFRGKVGDQVTLEVRRGDSTLQLTVRPIDIEPNKMFLNGMKTSARVFEVNGRRIGYVHVWCYAGYMYQRALEDLLSDGPLKDADSLIWDLRDGWGGAVPEYLDLFNTRAPTMEVFGRDRAGEFENVKWRKPVAMLINAGTRSGKEVLAYGFKKYRLGEVIGTRTEGAVLTATAFLIGGGLLLLAVEDVLVDGDRLEGVGVTPTIAVENSPGSDRQMDRAVAILSTA